MSVPPCMTDSNQTKNNFNVGTYRRISRPSKGPYYKKFRAQPSPEIFLAHLLKNTWKCLVWKYERWGVLGQGLFWRFCKKKSKTFHKNWSGGVPIGQFRKMFCVGGQPTKSVILGQRTEKSVIDGLHPRYKLTIYLQSRYSKSVNWRIDFQ